MGADEFAAQASEEEPIAEEGGRRSLEFQSTALCVKTQRSIADYDGLPPNFERRPILAKQKLACRSIPIRGAGKLLGPCGCVALRDIAKLLISQFQEMLDRDGIDLGKMVAKLLVDHRHCASRVEVGSSLGFG